MVLYRLEPQGVNEEDVVQATLVDFVRPAAVGSVSFTDYVQPGAYELRLFGNAAADNAAATFDLQLPAFDARDIPLDPNTGNNATLPLLAREPEASTGTTPHFLATSYVHVAAPPTRPRAGRSICGTPRHSRSTW